MDGRAARIHQALYRQVLPLSFLEKFYDLSQ